MGAGAAEEGEAGGLGEEVGKRVHGWNGTILNSLCRGVKRSAIANKRRDKRRETAGWEGPLAVDAKIQLTLKIMLILVKLFSMV